MSEHPEAVSAPTREDLKRAILDKWVSSRWLGPAGTPVQPRDETAAALAADAVLAVLSEAPGDAPRWVLSRAEREAVRGYMAGVKRARADGEQVRGLIAEARTIIATDDVTLSGSTTWRDEDGTVQPASYRRLLHLRDNREALADALERVYGLTPEEGGR